MAKEPAWRSNFERPDALLKPLKGRGLGGPIPIPCYVQRWLLVSGLRRRIDGGEDLAAAILREACDSYFRLHARPLPFDLSAGMELNTRHGRAALAQDIERLGPVAAGVANTVYGWIFTLPDTEDAADRFRKWVAQAWNIKAATVKRGGWPVITLPRGDWPIDPRLIPGTPVAHPRLVTTFEAGTQPEATPWQRQQAKGTHGSEHISDAGTGSIRSRPPRR